MENIVCCIIFGFFTIIGLSETIYFLIKRLFKSDDINKEKLTAENAEYILRSSKYHKINYNICGVDKNNEELEFIHKKLYQKALCKNNSCSSFNIFN